MSWRKEQHNSSEKRAERNTPGTNFVVEGNAAKKKRYQSNSEIKALLQTTMEAPPPRRKEQFFSAFSREKSSVSNFSFMLSQGAYIQKWVWLVSLLVLAVAVWGAGYYRQEAIWIVSALMPFAAMSVLVENSRSQVHNMAELEQATRFSLRSVVLARMSIIGVAHLILLTILVFFTGSMQMLSFGRTVVYLLVPYLLTNVLGLQLSRWLHSSANTYFFLAIACLVSVLGFGAGNMLGAIYESRNFGWWLVVLAVLIGMTISAYRRSLVQTLEPMYWVE